MVTVRECNWRVWGRWSLCNWSAWWIEKLLNKEHLYYRIGHNAMRVWANGLKKRMLSIVMTSSVGSTWPHYWWNAFNQQEIELMQIASKISAKAHTCKQFAPAWWNMLLKPSLIWAKWLCAFLQQYCRWRCCILHYVENNQPLKDGDLVTLHVNMSFMHRTLLVLFRKI